MALNYGMILTATGQAKLAVALAGGDPIQLKSLSVGDAGGTGYNPVGTETALRNTRATVDLEQLVQDPYNPPWARATGVIPATTGGFTIREVGIIDAAGALFAIARYPDTYKPVLTEGAAFDCPITCVLEVGSASAVTIVVDPSAVYATRTWVIGNQDFFAFVDASLSAPPASPVIGDQYLIPTAPSPTGAWSGKGGTVAVYQAGSTPWQFINAPAGSMGSDAQGAMYRRITTGWRPSAATQVEARAGSSSSLIITPATLQVELTQALSLVGGTPITNSVTKTVYGSGADFPDLAAAFAWLATQRITTGQVILQLAAGKFQVTSDQYYYHPNGDRISIRGQPIVGTLPNPGSLAYTGNGATARGNDTASIVTMLRTNYQTELVLNTTSKIVLIGNLQMMQDILVTTSGVTANAQLANIYISGGIVSMQRMATCMSGLYGLYAARSELTLFDKNYFIGNAFSGLHTVVGTQVTLKNGGTYVWSANGSYGAFAGTGSEIRVEDITNAGPIGYARGNGVDGFIGNVGSFVCSVNFQALNNGSAGYNSVNNAACRASGSTASGNLYGYMSAQMAYMDATYAAGSNTMYGHYAIQGGRVNRYGSNCTGSSASSAPAAGSTASDGGVIY